MLGRCWTNSGAVLGRLWDAAGVRLPKNQAPWALLRQPLAARSLVFVAEVRVQTMAQLLARLEQGHAFFFDINRLTRARISGDACFAHLDGKGPKTAQLDTIATAERLRYFVKDCGHQGFNVTQQKVRIIIRNALYQFRSGHKGIKTMLSLRLKAVPRTERFGTRAASEDAKSQPA